MKKSLFIGSLLGLSVLIAITVRADFRAIIGGGGSATARLSCPRV